MSAEDLVAGWKAIDDALADYEEAETFAKGEAEEYFSSDRIKNMIAQTGQPYRFNFAAVPIRSLLGRCELRNVGVADDEQATELLQEVFDDNDMADAWSTVLENTFTYGDSYVKVLPYEDDDPAGENDDPEDEELLSGIEITYMTPIDCRMIYDRRSDRRRAFFIERWCENPGAATEDREWRVDLWYPDRVEHWRKRRGGDKTQPSSWEPHAPDDSDDSAVELYEWGPGIPVFHLRTAKPYGVPVHKAAYAPQLAINKMLITQITTSEEAGWRQRYALTDEGAVLDQNTDGPDWDADEDAPGEATNAVGNRIGGQKSNLRGGPGTMQVLNGMREVGAFDPTDPTIHFMSPADSYIAMMAVLCDTPLHDFMRTIIPPSGESRRVAEQPLINKAKMMATRLTSPIKAMATHILVLLGVEEGQVIDVRWKPAYTANDTHDWQAVQLKQQAGVPTDQTLIEAGYDDRQVGKWLDETVEAMSLRQRVDLLVTIADAAQKLSAATASASGTSGMNVNPGGIINVLLNTAVSQNTNPA